MDVYEIVLIVYGHDGLPEYEKVTGHTDRPLEDVVKDFRADIAASASLGGFVEKHSGKKYRVELRDHDTGEVVNSYDGEVP